MVAVYLYSLIALVFFIGSFVELGIIPNQVSWSIEAIIVLLFLNALRQKAATHERFILFGAGFYVAFVVVCLLSRALNNTSFFYFLLFGRLCLRFYLLFLILLNLDLPENLIRRIHKLLVLLFAIQIPVALIKSFFFGIGEQTIGTYALSGGGNSTVIPLVAICFAICYYFLYRKHMYYLLLGLGFLVFGFIGGKRAIVPVVPALIAITAFTCIRYKQQIIPFGKWRVMPLLLLTLVTVPAIFYCGVRLMPTLNPDNKIWGRFSPEYAINYMREYNRGVAGEDLSYGRIETTIRIFQYLRDRGFKAILFGFGPGEFIMSSFGNRDYNYFTNLIGKLGVSYGVMTLNFLALQVGYIGAAIWIAFFGYAWLRLHSFARKETVPYWQAYMKSMECVSLVAIFMSLAYNNVFLEDDLMGLIYMMLLAFAVRRHFMCRSANKGSYWTHAKLGY